MKMKRDRTGERHTNIHAERKKEREREREREKNRGDVLNVTHSQIIKEDEEKRGKNPVASPPTQEHKKKTTKVYI